MNQLYESQYITEITYNNGNTIETLKYISNGHYIKYGEPDSNISEVNSWNDFKSGI